MHNALKSYLGKIPSFSFSPLLLVVLVLICIVDLFARVIQYRTESIMELTVEVRPVSFSHMKITAEIKNSFDELLSSYINPVVIEVVQEELINPTKALSEQGGLQTSLFIGDIEMHLLAIAYEAGKSPHIFVKEVNARQGSEVVRKYRPSDSVYGLELSVISMTEVRFSHPDLESDIHLKMFSRDEN